MRRVAFIGQKGGSGKSTLAIATAVELQRRGLRVVLVDLDRQGTCRDFAAAARDHGHSHPQVVSVEDGAAALLANLESAYDVAILDCPGRESAAGREALMLADVALVPVQPSPADLWASAETFAVARKAQGLRPGLAVLPVINRADARRRFSREVVDTLQAAGMTPMTAVIHDRADYPAAMATGQGPTTYAPDSKSAAEIESFVDEVLGLLKMEVNHARVA